MSELFDTVVQYLQQDQWPILLVPNQTVAVTRVQGEHGQWECQLYLREEQRQMVFYSICPVSVPEDRRVALAEFFARANYGLVLGNFEMDFTDGEVRYKTTLSLRDGRVMPADIQEVVAPNTLMMDKYLPGIQAAVESHLLPHLALELVEGSST